MKNLKIFDENGKALHIVDVINHFTKFKNMAQKLMAQYFT